MPIQKTKSNIQNHPATHANIDGFCPIEHFYGMSETSLQKLVFLVLTEYTILVKFDIEIQKLGGI